MSIEVEEYTLTLTPKATLAGFPANADTLKPVSLQTALQFKERLDNSGHELLEETWLGSLKPHRIRCGKCGRKTRVRPNNLQQGHGACDYCKYSDRKEQAYAEFLVNLADRECEPVGEINWTGVNSTYPVRCLKCGQETRACPNSLQQGWGACKYCAHAQRKQQAYAEFLVNLADRECEPVGEIKWTGTRSTYPVRCLKCGRETRACPNSLQQGRGACKYCPHDQRKQQAYAEFLLNLADRECEPVGEIKWTGVNSTYPVRCHKCGRETRVYPSSLQQGWGACKYCAWENQDVFYVVSRPDGSVKFGITSGDPKSRLSAHRYWGYRQTDYLVTGLPKGIAIETETAAKTALKLEGFEPEHGTEYFGAEARTTVIKLAEHYLDGYKYGCVIGG